MIPVLVLLENWGKSGKLDPNIPNHGHQYTESHLSKVLNSLFHIKWSFTKIQISFEGWFTPFLVYLGHWGISGNLRPNTQIYGRVIQSAKLHISHQMEPYSSVKVICLVKLYLLKYILGIGASWGDSAQILSIIGTNTQKIIHSVKLHISHQMERYLSVKAMWRSTYTYFVYLWNCGTLGKFSPTTWNHGQNYTESHPKC